VSAALAILYLYIRYILLQEGEVMATAKVFKSGNSQAIRLPKEFRFPPDTEEVEIYREGARIVLGPVPAQEWPESFWRAFGAVTDDFERPPQRRQTRRNLEDETSS
jgi:antitoxin VapB